MAQRFVASATLGIAIASVAGYAQSSDSKATALMAQARTALGGEQKLASLKALSIRGSYRREASVPPGAGGGGGSVMIVMSGPGPGGEGPQSTGDLEIDVEFPDNYLKVDAGTGMMAMTRTEGFEGDRPFTDIVSSAPGMRILNSRPVDDPNAVPMALRRSREDLARLLLGLIAGVQPSFPVTYGYAGQAESPDGKADVIEVKGADLFAARLFLDAGSHQPLMLTYMAPEPRVMMRTSRGDGPPANVASHSGPPPQTRTADGLSPEEKARMDQIAAPAKLVEYRVFFTDFREVNGLLLPHHITKGTESKTTEEWEIKSYKVNPSIKADRFKVGR
ncbi:MAG: hypothetical protein ABIX28_19705 [Vicinamibacterales bacterium]